jgi:hypothetical protein
MQKASELAAQSAAEAAEALRREEELRARKHSSSSSSSSESGEKLPVESQEETEKKTQEMLKVQTLFMMKSNPKCLNYLFHLGILELTRGP